MKGRKEALERETVENEEREKDSPTTEANRRVTRVDLRMGTMICGGGYRLLVDPRSREERFRFFCWILSLGIRIIAVDVLRGGWICIH